MSDVYVLPSQADGPVTAGDIARTGALQHDAAPRTRLARRDAGAGPYGTAAISAGKLTLVRTFKFRLPENRRYQIQRARGFITRAVLTQHRPSSGAGTQRLAQISAWNCTGFILLPPQNAAVNTPVRTLAQDQVATIA